MNWKVILVTFAFMVLGYIVGSILNSIWVTKLFGLSDVRLSGSKNAGATNVNRIHGKKIGLIVFILDVFKPILVMILTKIIVGASGAIIQAVGIAVVIGHIFPIFHRFKGGKGAACMLGVMVTINWTLFFIGATIFFAIVLTSKKVSLGSLFAPMIMIIIYISLSQTSNYNSKTFEPITHSYSYWINVIAMTLIVALIVYSHRQNIKLLLKRQERSYKN